MYICLPIWGLLGVKGVNSGAVAKINRVKKSSVILTIENCPPSKTKQNQNNVRLVRYLSNACLLQIISENESSLLSFQNVNSKYQTWQANKKKINSNQNGLFNRVPPFSMFLNYLCNFPKRLIFIESYLGDFF